jgi:glycosyltransferase involved in cell wall biosynthesis
VAIVHDWLVGGGAEKVVEQLHQMYPEAPIYTSYCTAEWRKRLDNKVITGPLQMWPFSKLRKYIPFLRIWWFTSLKLDHFDLVISSSGAEAKGIKTHSSTIHVNYCHAPTHYYWSRYDEYLKHPGFGKFDGLARFGLKTLVGPLRRWDFKAAQRPDLMIANSTHTQQSIQKYYIRKSVVIHPPVDVERFGIKKSVKNRQNFVITGRHVPYKRFDLAIEACSKLNLPLTVLGSGPDTNRLKRLAEESITFLGRVDDETVVSTIASSKAFIFPGIDDFGIAPVEALAAGTPVVAYKAGGALDYVIPGRTGEFFDQQTVNSLVETLEQFKPSNYSSDDIRNFSKNFSNEEFRKNLTKVLEPYL